MTTRYIRKTIAIDLKKSYNDLWKGYSKNNQRNITKAKNLGLSAEIATKTLTNITKFQQLYELTMKRTNSSKYYYFHKSLFSELLSEDSLYESYLLFANYQNQVVGGIILLIGMEFAHYQFGASHPDYLNLKPNNFLFDFMIRFCQEKGAKLLHLGGGYEENDGLFRYKSTFSNSDHYSYYLGTNIHDQKVFEQLNEIASKYDSYNPNFFPAYRSVLSK
ncbi:GNAT family N-acetyltransferase [Bacillus sp. JJ1532]|uniref:GNAT family N-acetyltransferase n=1 Tax=Bacillus sp. JJ1532 TaxID=3122958 RepID=UPI003000AA82